MTDNQDDVDRLASARLIELAISGIGTGFYKEIAFKPHQWQQIIAALRQADLAQTEIKGHMRVEDELKERAARVADERDFLERNYKRIEAKLAQAQARIAELEKDNKLWHANWEAAYAEKQAAEQDAARYRWLREHFRFSHDNLHELWFDEDISPHAAVTIASREELDSTIDEAALKSRA